MIPISWWPLVFAIIVLITDLIWQFYWAGYSGPRKAKDLTIDAFKDRDTAREVRTALDLPDRESIQSLMQKIETLPKMENFDNSEVITGLQKKVSDIAGKTALLDQLVLDQAKVTGEVKDCIQNMNIEIPPLEIDEGLLETKITRSVKGAMAQLKQAEEKEVEDIIDEFDKSQEADETRELVYQWAVDAGYPEPAVRYGVQHGPKVLHAILERYAETSILGKALMGALEDYK